ncbi:MAG: flagellar basal-body rod protein FlgF [Syntrophales bacterium]|nr:flagellar basal-body rod protein FlgF [Syntrophales bacterium]
MGRLIQKLDHVSTNLSNASTTGYKAEHLYAAGQGALPPVQSGDLTLPPVSVAIDFSKGLIQQSGNNLDIRLESDGFFTVQTKNGLAYTRRGDFTLNSSGVLVTQTGDLVMGEGGPITIKGQDISINKDGSIKVDAADVGKLRVVTFSDLTTLTRTDDGYFSSSVAPIKTDNPDVVQGAIELSNVNVVREMVDMIDIQRSFEVYSKVIQSISDEDKVSTGRVGRLV